MKLENVAITYALSLEAVRPTRCSRL